MNIKLKTSVYCDYFTNHNIQVRERAVRKALLFLLKHNYYYNRVKLLLKFCNNRKYVQKVRYKKIKKGSTNNKTLSAELFFDILKIN